MLTSSASRIGVLRDEPSSSFLTDIFEEPELVQLTKVIILDLKRIRRGLICRLVSFFCRFVLLAPHSTSAIRAEQFVVRLVARSRRLSHLVALDNKLELLSPIAKKLRCSGTNCYVVQLGTNPKYYSAEPRKGARIVPITMLCWGSRERDTYSRLGLIPEEFSVVGSLKVPIAERRNKFPINKNWDLCIVSQFRPFPKETDHSSTSSIFEAQSMPQLIQLLRPILIRNKFRTIVAVKAGRRLYDPNLEEQEIAFYRSVLGDVAEIGVSDNPYANYAFAGASRLIIGRNSALLTEMLGSRARVLFVNSTEYTVFDAPEEMPYRLSRPSETELEAQILTILNEGSDDYRRKVESLLQKHCACSEDSLTRFGEALNLRPRIRVAD